MKRRQNTPNTKGDEDMPTARIYPHDGIEVPGYPAYFTMRSGNGVYAVALTGAIVRVGEKGQKK